jgi:hypothetical protein
VGGEQRTPIGCHDHEVLPETPHSYWYCPLVVHHLRRGMPSIRKRTEKMPDYSRLSTRVPPPGGFEVYL